MNTLFTLNDLKDLILNGVCEDGTTLEQALDFCESIIFDETYSRIERFLFERLYKVLLLICIGYKSPQLPAVTQSVFDTPHKIPDGIYKEAMHYNGYAKQHKSFDYAYDKKRYNF